MRTIRRNQLLALRTECSDSSQKFRWTIPWHRLRVNEKEPERDGPAQAFKDDDEFLIVAEKNCEGRIREREQRNNAGRQQKVMAKAAHEEDLGKRIISTVGTHEAPLTKATAQQQTHQRKHGGVRCSENWIKKHSGEVVEAATTKSNG